MSEAVGNDFELNVDVTDVAAWDGNSGPLIDPGTYVLQILSAEQSNSKQNQPVLKVQFEVSNEGPWLGAKFTRSYSLQKSALPRFKQLVMACGAPLTAARREHFVGAYIQADIVHKEGQAKPAMDGTMEPGKPQMDVVNEQPVPEASGVDAAAVAAAEAAIAVEAAAAAAAKAAPVAASATAAATAAAANGAAAAKPPIRRAAAATAKA